MDADEPSKKPVLPMIGEDLSTLSAHELKARIALLEDEIARHAAAIKARWVCEQAHQQLKEELGLDHFEGRSWHGLHRHALMTMIAYAYLQSRRLAEASGGKKSPPRTDPWPPSRPDRQRRFRAKTPSATALVCRGRPGTAFA